MDPTRKLKPGYHDKRGELPRLPLIDDPHRHPGMPPVGNDRPIDVRQQCSYLTNIADIIVPQAESCRKEMIECERLRRSLLKICTKVVNEAAEEKHGPTLGLDTALVCFGSLRSGIALRGSDMDMLLKVTSAQEGDLINALCIPRQLQKALILEGYGARLVTNTRVPVLKLCTQPTQDLINALLQEFRQWEAEQKGLPAPCADSELVRLFNLAISDGWYNNKDKKIIKNFEDAVENSKGNAKDKALCSTRAMLKRLPKVIERYTGPKTMHDLEFPPRGIGIHCDINFSGEMARHNTQLIRCYMRCDDRLRHMVIFVKAWAMHREINRPYDGTLCSYGYVLMVLHFAVNVANPPLCPNLQHQLGGMRGGAGHVPRECQGYNIQFWRDEKQIELAAHRGMLTYNQQAIGSLLRGFFAYYAGMKNDGNMKRFTWWDDALSLRSADGLLPKKVKGWTSARTEIIPGITSDQPQREIRHRYLFAIEDPFEIDHNVARTVTHFGMCAIKDEFRRAHRLIQHGGLIGDMAIDLMEKGEAKEVLYPGLGGSDRIIQHHPSRPPPTRQPSKSKKGGDKAAAAEKGKGKERA
jgi:terminal uridylyltransferase